MKSSSEGSEQHLACPSTCMLSIAAVGDVEPGERIEAYLLDHSNVDRSSGARAVHLTPSAARHHEQGLIPNALGMKVGSVLHRKEKCLEIQLGKGFETSSY